MGSQVHYSEENPQEWYLRGFPQELGERAVPTLVGIGASVGCHGVLAPGETLRTRVRMTTGGHFLVLGYVCLREGNSPQ